MSLVYAAYGNERETTDMTIFASFASSAVLSHTFRGHFDGRCDDGKRARGVNDEAAVKIVRATTSVLCIPPLLHACHKQRQKNSTPEFQEI